MYEIDYDFQQFMRLQTAAKLKKNHDEFTFEKEIFLDKYLHENRKKLKETLKVEDVKALKQREKNIENELKNLEAFDPQGNSAEYILRYTSKFLKSQIREIKENDYVNIDAVSHLLLKFFHNETIQSGDIDEKLLSSHHKRELEAALETINKLQTKVHKRVEELQERKERVSVTAFAGTFS